ncbi:UNVERIFIED_CONTAM: Copia protein [Sesamum radiatum]|uniref:Copia protein n=1 Tax=Sesamum radiatum TaxID=300843 RepID=A0AAW2S231_SESRA
MASTLNTTVDATTSGFGNGNELANARIPVVEHPGMIMVSTPLNSSNWLSWSRSVRIALEGRDKLGFIDGTYAKPAADSLELQQWRITDSTVRTWILNTISKDIVNAFLYASSARALWLDLEARYRECDGVLLYKLHKEVTSMSQGTMTMTTYYTKLKQLWDELACLKPPDKADQDDETQLIQFLMGLNDSFDNIRNQILVLEPLPKVNKAYSMVLRVERQHQVRGFEPRGNAGLRNFMRRKEPVDKRNLYCEHCNRSGHNRENCLRLHRFPEWYKDLQKKKGGPIGRANVSVDGEQFRSLDKHHLDGNDLISDLMEALRMLQNKAPQDPVQVHFAQIDEMACMVFRSHVSCKNNSSFWIVDTGATSHMCGDERLFHSLHPLNHPLTIFLPDNSVTQATQSGDIKLSSSIILTNVLFIPSFKHNLLSVSQLCRSLPVCFMFLTSSCIMQDLKTKRTLAVGKQINKLYTLDSDSFSSTHCHQLQINNVDISCSVTDSSLYSLWHKRLGHAAPIVLSHIPELKCDSTNNTQTCSVCPLAKQSRASFPLSDSCTLKPFELIHVDIWGPYKQSSLSGCHYVLTIVDDFSRVTWTYLMHHKSQTLQILSNFFPKIHTQFDTKVQAIRTDNGSEFLSLPCQELFQKHGILHQKTCFYTPQQNGVVERKHRHLLQVARALMFESYLPRHFWGESILTATHIINRLPSVTLGWKSPFELLYNIAPSYATMKTFGCLCFASNVHPHKSKFDQRAFKSVFIGYVHGQKAFKLYDIDNKKIIISRDVVFHEAIFPYKSLSSTLDSCPLPVPITTVDIPISSTDTPSSSSTLTDSIPSSSPTIAPVSEPTLLRRSQRHIKPPTWLHDFHCNTSVNQTIEPSSLTSSHISFMAALSTIQEPRSYL